MKALLRSVTPPWIRIARSRLLHWLAQDASHFERLDRADFMRRAFRALHFNRIGGDYAEFGCCGGATFALAHRNMTATGGGRHLWAFDSFRGLPPSQDARDAHPMWVGGDMAISLADFHAVCAASKIPHNDYTIIEGFFERTLADPDPAREDRPPRIAFAYVDCDLYSSTLDVLSFLAPRLTHGMIIAFDDYFCWSKDRVSGERLALVELEAARPDFRFTPYLAFGWHGQSFVVERADQLHPDPQAVHRLRAAAASAMGHDRTDLAVQPDQGAEQCTTPD